MEALETALALVMSLEMGILLSSPQASISVEELNYSKDNSCKYSIIDISLPCDEIFVY
jgi:hypothetical protein